MILQDNDPHHLHPDLNYIYYFVISAVILVAVVLVVGWKLMSYLDNRKTENQPENKDSKPLSENKERLK